MLKWYAIDHQLHMVGKAWTIRSKLREWIRHSHDPHAPLSEQLHKMAILTRQGVKSPPPQHNKRREKMQHRPENPVPLK